MSLTIQSAAFGVGFLATAVSFRNFYCRERDGFDLTLDVFALLVGAALIRWSFA